MKKTKWIALALTLLLMLSLSPAALAQELPFPAEWFTGFGAGLSLRSMIDENKGHIDLAGSSFQLENLIFFDDAVVDEDSEICLVETTRDAMILDENTLPEGLKAEVRREKVRVPDGRDGVWVAEEIRREKAGQPAPEEPKLDEADKDRETYYLYLTGKPKQAGEYLFVLWDGTIKLCNVTVLRERATPTDRPTTGQPSTIMEQTWGGPAANPGTVSEEWVDTSVPAEQPGNEQQAGNEQQGNTGMTESWIDNFTGSFEDIYNSIVQTPSTPSQEPTVSQPYFTEPTPTPYVPTPTPYVPTPTPAPNAAVPTLPDPTVTIAGSTSVYTGDRAVLEARVSNAFDVSYQWYVGLGNYWSPIEDGTGNSAQYRPDTSRAGTYAYLCRIISSGYGQQTYADSEPVIFTIADRPAATPTPTPKVNKTIRSVTVGKLPNKVDYNDGEAVDASGLQLRVLYTDGTYDMITSGFVVTTQTVSYNNTGLADVNVNYRGYQTSYQVKVHSVAELIRGIGVLTMPNKSSYNVGEYLNTAGLTIRVYSTDGRYLDVGEGFTCSPTYFSNPGNQTVTVSFMGKTCTFTVAVQQAKRIVGLSIQSLPANRSYTVGDTINTAGLVLQLQTTSGYETVTSGYTISPRVATTAGSQQITVNYEGMSTSYTIDVRSNIPYATPTPAPTPYYGTTTPNGTMPTPLPYGTTPAPYGVSPSPAPYGTVSPSPTGFPMPSASVAPTPVHTPAPARRNTGVSTAVKVLFVVAVVALGGLIGYVIYLRKTGGDEDEFVDEPKASEKIRNIFRKK